MKVCLRLLEKINHIEMLLPEINFKIDNFLGVEELSEERKEIESIQKEVESGTYLTLDEIFGD